MKPSIIIIVAFLCLISQNFGQELSSWLKDLPSDAKKQFEDTISNGNLTKAEVNKKLDELAKKQAEPFKSKYEESKKAYEKQKTLMDKAHSERMMNASSQAQLADAQIVAVRNDLTITRNEEYMRIKTILEAQPPEILHELNENAPYQHDG